MTTEAFSLYNDDCFNVLQSIESGSVRLIATDPPYNIHVGDEKPDKKRINVSLRKIPNNIVSGYDIERFAEQVERIQGRYINCYFWCNKSQIPEYFKSYVEKRGCKFDILCWHKNNAVPTYSNKYLTDTEYCLFFHKGRSACHPRDYADATTYYIAPMNTADKKTWKHPTIKHLDFACKLIRNSTKEGDTVLDPFMGSGTFVVAALLEGRKALGVEIDATYYDTACKRILQTLQEQKSNLFK